MECAACRKDLPSESRPMVCTWCLTTTCQKCHVRRYTHLHRAGVPVGVCRRCRRTRPLHGPDVSLCRSCFNTTSRAAAAGAPAPRMCYGRRAGGRRAQALAVTAHEESRAEPGYPKTPGASTTCHRRVGKDARVVVSVTNVAAGDDLDAVRDAALAEVAAALRYLRQDLRYLRQERDRRGR